jgi:membrane protease YdiL (CAAX protease family)
MGFIAAAVATLATIAIWDRGTWDLGLFVRPGLAAREALLGFWWGGTLIASCAILVILTSNIREHPGNGFPWGELMTTFLPAAVHEELVFRGYGFQRLYRWHPRFALIFVALVFAALHAGNSSVTVLGLVNVFLGGVLLGLAYARFRRLWFPIGIHLSWNLMTGPVLGHEVSGYHSARTLLVERGSGPAWITGGDFGLEGSAWMTLVVLIAIILMNFRSVPRVAGADWKESTQ